MSSTQMIDIELIEPNPQQPRKHFDQAELIELSNSIFENGLINPITVEGPHTGSKQKHTYTYYLIAGERRLRASKLAGLKEIECIVKDPMTTADDQKRSVIALVENIQRSNLAVIDEAKAIKKLKDEQDLTNTQIAQKLGISLPRVTLALKTLKLDEPILDLINNGSLVKDTRAVDALLTIPDSKSRIKIATDLASRNAGVKACVEACARLVCHLNEEKIPTNEVPSIRLAKIKTGEVNRPVYDVIAAAGRVPPWPLVEIAARNVCERCALRDDASKTVCDGCTLVEFLQDMVGKTNKG
jgi:ParB family transcriptional regulator, chromosome partitioning protein